MSDRIYSIDLIPSCHTMFGYFTEFLQSFNWYKHLTLINHYQSIRSIDFVSYFHFVIQRVSKIKLIKCYLHMIQNCTLPDSSPEIYVLLYTKITTKLTEERRN